MPRSTASPAAHRPPPRTHLKKSDLQKSFPSRLKHLSVRAQPQSEHRTHSACHVLSSTVTRNFPVMGFWQPLQHTIILPGLYTAAPLGACTTVLGDNVKPSLTQISNVTAQRSAAHNSFLAGSERHTVEGCEGGGGHGSGRGHGAPRPPYHRSVRAAADWPAEPHQDHPALISPISDVSHRCSLYVTSHPTITTIN